MWGGRIRPPRERSERTGTINRSNLFLAPSSLYRALRAQPRTNASGATQLL